MSNAFQALEASRCSAILRTSDADAVAPAMDAAIEGGFDVIEFTLTIPNALESIAAFAKRNEAITVGAGTVLNIADAQSAVDAGAQFVVSPVTDPEVIGWCVQHGITVIPGAATPTEMLCAHEAGADLIKLFPGPPNGPDVVRACLGPMPFLRIFPTSGATLENVGDYFQAGAFGVGFVQPLFDPAAMAARDFSAIRARATRLIEAVNAAKD